MGLFALAVPAMIFTHLFHRQSRNRDYDPEKAVRRDSDVSNGSGHEDSDGEGRDHSSHDILTSDTHHRRFRRVYSTATRTVVSGLSSSDDLSQSAPSVFKRFKDYVWPSDEGLVDLDSFVPNYRWIPIVAGTIIPFSILLEIPGLTEKWYIKTENNQIVAVQPNPPILDIGVAFSMACVAIANLLLILRFLEIRIKTVTLLCFLFLTVHDIINIVIITVFGVEHRFDDGFTYGQAFWSTLCSTAISSCTNILLITDFIRTPEFAKRGSGLTRKQRALVILVMVLLLYIAFCGLLSSIILDLTYINGLYFTVVSIETIGFGDIVPVTTGARVWTCLFISFGVITIGVAIAMCRETIMEGLEIGYRRRVRDLRERRRDARRFRRWEARWRRAVEFRLREKGEQIWVADAPKGDEDAIRVLGLDTGIKLPFFKRVGTKIKRTATVDSVLHPRHRRQHLNVEALSNAELEEAALEAGVPLEMFCDLGARRDELHHTPMPELLAHVHAAAAPDPLGVVHAVQDTRTAALHHALSSGWVGHPETPTQAQLGRMAAMLTKFGLAVSGHHVHPPGQPHGAYVEEAAVEHPHRPPPHAPVSSARPWRTSLNGSLLDGDGGGDVCRHPTTRWLKEFAKDVGQRPAWNYEKLKEVSAQEERRAYYAKLTIAWSLFLVFWLAGAGIFCATEGWTYGIGVYFCFIAFTTTGYGDYTPETPAGRSIFVFWALFGVGTLTILVSVLQEAGSSRYKTALHSRVFDKAVKNYRKNNKQILDVRHPLSAFEKDHDHLCNPTKPIAVRLQEAQEKTQRALELLPCDVVRNAKTFRDYVSFFVSASPGGIEGLAEAGIDIGAAKVPPDMRKLLDELGDIEGISARLKSEILQDDDARKTLFMLGLERNLKKLVGAAEKALLALTERDALATLDHQEQREKEKRRGRSSLARRPTGFAFDQLDLKRHDDDADRTHTVRAHSEPPPSGSRRVERIPRTGSETSIRGPENEPTFFLTNSASPISGRSRGTGRRGQSASSSSSSDVDDSESSSSAGPSGS
ncbi:transporter [Ganoderma sinense ZZ0214-1]|uniref:Transporter n=1 Tax=Ganoderma sinense ZZ0214-1 TaxID=1077348 RepID=A0A2G8S2D0_9APHY|nr:transporter [Ganoderma sinense ZZ0214-1]